MGCGEEMVILSGGFGWALRVAICRSLGVCILVDCYAAFEGFEVRTTFTIDALWATSLVMAWYSG